MLQDFKACMQSPELTLCVKDVNLLLGSVDSVDKMDYRSLIPEAYGLLSARLAVWFISDDTKNVLLLHLHMDCGASCYTWESVDMCMPTIAVLIRLCDPGQHSGIWLPVFACQIVYV